MTRPLMTLALISSFFISGCLGTNATRQADQFRIKTIDLNERALANLERGNKIEAIELLNEAYRVSAARDDSAGQAVALINLGRIYRQTGELDKAKKEIGRALPLVSGTGLAADASQEMALLELALGNLDKADEWALEALKKEDGKLKGRRLNLLARIAFQKGKHADADHLAEEALSLNRSNGPVEEEANSLRLLGKLRTAQAKLEDAEQFLVRALEKDKSVGNSARIADDLEALAKLSSIRGNDSASRDYLDRARNVRNNIRKQ